VLIEREQSIVACARGIPLDAVAAENREAGWKFWVANWQQAVSEHIELWQRSTTTTKGNIESSQAVEVKCEYYLPGHAYHGKSKGRRLLASLEVGTYLCNALASREGRNLVFSGCRLWELRLYQMLVRIGRKNWEEDMVRLSLRTYVLRLHPII
jgi:hypothetical protein